MAVWAHGYDVSAVRASGPGGGRRDRRARHLDVLRRRRDARVLRRARGLLPWLRQRLVVEGLQGSPPVALSLTARELAAALAIPAEAARALVWSAATGEYARRNRGRCEVGSHPACSCRSRGAASKSSQGCPAAPHFRPRAWPLPSCSRSISTPSVWSHPSCVRKGSAPSYCVRSIQVCTVTGGPRIA